MKAVKIAVVDIDMNKKRLAFAIAMLLSACSRNETRVGISLSGEAVREPSDFDPNGSFNFVIKNTGSIALSQCEVSFDGARRNLTSMETYRGFWTGNVRVESADVSPKEMLDISFSHDTNNQVNVIPKTIELRCKNGSAKLELK